MTPHTYSVQSVISLCTFTCIILSHQWPITQTLFFLIISLAIKTIPSFIYWTFYAHALITIKIFHTYTLIVYQNFISLLTLSLYSCYHAFSSIKRSSSRAFLTSWIDNVVSVITRTHETIEVSIRTTLLRR